MCNGKHMQWTLQPVRAETSTTLPVASVCSSANLQTGRFRWRNVFGETLGRHTAVVFFNRSGHCRGKPFVGFDEAFPSMCDGPSICGVLFFQCDHGIEVSRILGGQLPHITNCILNQFCSTYRNFFLHGLGFRGYASEEDLLNVMQYIRNPLNILIVCLTTFGPVGSSTPRLYWAVILLSWCGTSRFIFATCMPSKIFQGSVAGTSLRKSLPSRSKEYILING
ncbi:hypothetical protein BJ138DRAFT_1140474 [Hygrophoropsis aurantiaca]|uniref:Uncharacterized protein n=1 Tax=Hygrophoropsis aurantiaca TaxID=72124 RepID=A0ACB8ASK8_9AGAM|nr:hypothetical protein BJ138DRAFT_1140474 [Hygrophoropsis aurantiaca]